MSYRLLPAAALAVAASAALAADEAELEPMTVTAERERESAHDSLAAVSVITREDIERLNPQSVLDLLRGEAGVDVARSGPLGSNTSVFLRGTESDHVLVLIDGVRAASATSGTFSWSQLDPAQIERIEIVRGPRSTLYGSEAIGGVIQIFTRDAAGPSVRLEGGTYETVRAGAGIGGSTGDAGSVNWSVNAGYRRSNGFSAKSPDASFGFDPDDDGYEEASVTAGLSAPLGSEGALRLRGWLAAGEVEFDQGVTDTVNATVNARYRRPIGEDWRQTLSLGYAIDDRETESAFPADITSRRLSADWQHDIALTEGLQLTSGVDFYRDDGENIAPASGRTTIDETLHNVGVYADLDTRLWGTDVEVGLRHDEHSEFGGETTGQVAVGRDLSERLTAFASYGSAFKAPTFNELFFPGFGNPDLDAETSRSWEVGAKYRFKTGGTIRLSGFGTQIDDLIDAVLVDPSSFAFQARNVDEASVTGVELDYEQPLGEHWRLAGDVTLQDADNDSEDRDLLRRPDEKLNLRLTRRFAGDASATAEAVYQGERKDVGNVTLDDYVLVNLSVRYPFASGVSLEARVENLLDEQYRELAGFNTPDTSVFLGIRYTPR